MHALGYGHLVVSAASTLDLRVHTFGVAIKVTQEGASPPLTIIVHCPG